MVNIGAPPPNEKPKNHLSPINPGTAPNAEYNVDNRLVVSCCTFQAETHRIIEPLLSTVSVLCEAICFTNGRYFGSDAQDYVVLDGRNDERALSEDQGRLKAKANKDYIDLLDTAIKFCNLAQREDSSSQWDKIKNSKKKNTKYYRLRDANFCKQIKKSLHD